MTKQGKSIVKENHLKVGGDHVQVGSRRWYEWLDENKTFRFENGWGHFQARCERRRNQIYWYAYRRRSGKLTKVYLGKSDELDLNRLEQASVLLAGHALYKPNSDQFGEKADPGIESRIDSASLPRTKTNVPILPQKLVARARLTQQINTPLTLIYAPSGFGKSTLINEWKQASSYPVAWLSLDENENQLARFWYSVITAFQVALPDFGDGMSLHPNIINPLNLPEIMLRLTNEIIKYSSDTPKMGLVLDDFHLIRNSEVFDSVQMWIGQLPPGLHLIISGHVKPPLAVGHLRAKGLVTEIDVNELRFTLEEGIDYLRQYQQDPPLAYDDLEKLARHTEGWAAGLTLTALALSKQENRRQFIDTFSGAHIYLREYFMETVLQRTTPEIQAFLLKTAILKHLTGSLCDALTGRKDGAEVLARLWQENLFIVQMEQQGWYRYHDLFSEMLYSQLLARYPDEVRDLHQRAAQWYSEQYAPAEAIYHLLATKAWEEAASLIEEMALRELAQYGEDSRLLRWLQELPEGVVQKHKTLLFVYLRLANVALPQNKIEFFITRIEHNIASKPPILQTQDERDVLAEIRQIRRTWAQGGIFLPQLQMGSAFDEKWDVLQGLHFLKRLDVPEPITLEKQITNVLHMAEMQRNLFVILMAASSLARRAISKGYLRRGERIAKRSLEQAIAQRGKLPETASISLAALSHIHLERNEIELAQRYLNQSLDVDPNPTSTNMPVQYAILRAKIQVAKGQYDEARVTIQAVRDLHRLRPSGMWHDQDLRAYEALVCIRAGDIVSAENLMNEVDDISGHPFSQVIQAEILYKKRQPDIVEYRLQEIINQNPGGLQFESLMDARVLLALALSDQYKIHEARQAMAEVIRFAAPERYFRPIIERGSACAPLLTVVLGMENITIDAKGFINDLLEMLGDAGKYVQLSNAQLKALSASASISSRERDVLRLLSVGQSNREMAQNLSISESTVKTHLSNIYSKLDVTCRVQAVARASELHLV